MTVSASDAAILTGLGLAFMTLAFALSAGLGVLAQRKEFRFGLVDFPGGPLRHRVPVSLAGGISVWFSFIVVIGLAALVLEQGRLFLPEAIVRYVNGLWYRAGELAVILALATGVLVVGLVSDLAELGWRFRLAGQVVLAIALAVWGPRVTLFWPLSIPLVGGLVTVLWVVGLANAFNFLDNMDGLAAGVGIAASLLFAAAQVQVGSLFAPAVLLVLAGVLGGFLIHNRFPAQLFLGDSGSDFLGFLLGAMTVAGTYYRYGAGDSPYNVLSPLFVMAVPLYEAASVFLIWLGERHNPFTWNRHHFSYRLLESGLSPPQAVRAIVLVSVGSGLGALLLHRLDAIGAVVVSGQSICLIGVVALLEIAAIRRRRADRWERQAGARSSDVASNSRPPSPSGSEVS
jgi:UDP-GlcNAc:undecaprenyl-phosphate GlcNAc-1-phosphate transferase